MLEILAKTNLPVLLLGETGCGKSHFAKEIHKSSKHSGEKFLAVNLSALPRDLIESQLFGYEAGSFTGAVKSKRGMFEEVGAGTLFLDEIGEIDLALQKKLLLVLEDREFRPLGGERVVRLRCKLIFATNQSLEKLIEEKKFRSDLYYRIAGHTHTMKTLRERLRMEPDFIEKFYEDQCRNGLKRLLISEDCLSWMNKREWPGNLRQLKMALEAAVDLVKEGDKTIRLACMLKTIAAKGESKGETENEGPLLRYHEALANFELTYFTRAMREHEGRINQISRVLSVNKTTLLAKLRRYDMKTEQFKKTPLKLLKACS